MTRVLETQLSCHGHSSLVGIVSGYSSFPQIEDYCVPLPPSAQHRLHIYPDPDGDRRGLHSFFHVLSGESGRGTLQDSKAQAPHLLPPTYGHQLLFPFERG